jgi:RNA polymerase sigma factor (sigma-70 family)
MSGHADSLTGDATREFLRRRTDRGWGPFVDHYGRTIFRWAVGCWRLGEDEATDLTQQVLVKLWEKMSQPDAALWDPEKGRFHAWLKAVARHAWSDACKASKRAGQVVTPEVLELLNNDTAGADFVEKLAEKELWELALANTRQRVSTTKWEVFRLVRVEDLPGPEVASRTGLTLQVVHNYTSQVGQVFQEEWRRLTETCDELAEVGP